MHGMVLIASFTALTAFCWGTYGPILQVGNKLMKGTAMTAGLRAFIGVGLAYFVIAVIVPGLWLSFRKEKGNWTASGLIWSLVAGAAGALGALGIILALGYRGNPIYVMPLVFGGAPVVNTFVTMYLTKNSATPGPIFFAGLILVLVGVVTVLVMRPTHGGEELSFMELIKVLLSVLMTALCWGTYGPLLHKGQAAMSGSRLRPLLCVGIAYLVIAVIGPALHFQAFPDQGEMAPAGLMWSMAAGAAGAIGALGLILAFNAGGKPIYVMPLVFGFAPVINTLVSLIQNNAFGKVGPLFYAGLIIVIAGAVTVLIFAPRAAPHAVAEK